MAGKRFVCILLLVLLLPLSLWIKNFNSSRDGLGKIGPKQLVKTYTCPKKLYVPILLMVGGIIVLLVKGTYQNTKEIVGILRHWGNTGNHVGGKASDSSLDATSAQAVESFASTITENTSSITRNLAVLKNILMNTLAPDNQPKKEKKSPAPLPCHYEEDSMVGRGVGTPGQE